MTPPMIIYATVYAALDGALSITPIISATAAALLLFCAWWVPRVGARLPGRLMSIGLVAALVIAAHAQGGFQPGILPWLAAGPLIATVLAGPRMGIVAALIGAGDQIALLVLSQAGLISPTLPARPPGLAHDLVVLDTILVMAVVTVMGTLYEISRRRTEAYAQRTMKDLRHANRKLRQARDAADQANHAKTQFVANISHELRTPMNGVIGMTDLLRSSELNEEQIEYTETVHRSARSLLGIINDILDFSKLDFDKLELTEQRYDLETVIEEALSLLTAEAFAKGLELSATIGRDVPSEVVGDAGRLRQVLLNLINNAVKFTHSGEVNLSCTLVKMDEPQALLRFEVIDTGIGIDRSLLPKIFDAFYQTDNSTTRQHGGTGLGLAISKRLVELMGGQIGIDSNPGKGSSFYFTHPVQIPEDVLDIGDERSGTFTGLRGLCLVLGERPRARRALIAQLEREGVLADNAPSAEEALTMLARAQEQELPYRVVLLDVPNDDELALQIADRLRRAHLKVSPAVVLLTTPSQRNLRARAQALGFANPITKPARRASLMAGVSSALSEASRNRPARTGSGRVVAQAPATGHGHLLLAEDNETNRRTAVLMLRKMGYEVHIATNGQEVLQLIAQRRYDAILMDCQMPILDGYAAASQIRTLDHDARHTTIIAMTAHASASDRRRCLDAGMNDYLPKPVRFEDLRDMLDKWLHGKSAGAAQAQTLTPDEAAGGVDLRMLQSLRLLAGEDQHMVNALIQTYLDEAPEIIEDLSLRLANRDALGSADAVHKLKSCSGNLGAHRLAELCFTLEGQARANNLDEADQLLARIQAEYRHVQAILLPLNRRPH